MAGAPLQPPSGVRTISSAGELLDPGTAAWLERGFRCPARDHFGQTELGMVLCDHPGLEHPRRTGPIGYPLPGFTLATVTPAGKECAPGQPGLLSIAPTAPRLRLNGYHTLYYHELRGNYFSRGDRDCP